MLSKHTGKKLSVLFLCLTTIIVFTCKKSDSLKDTLPVLEPPVKADDAVKVTATVTGTVIDENNKPVASAAVTSGTYAATTDAMGNFIIKDASISKANGNVTVVKTGYFKGIRSFVTNAGKNNYVKIQLIKQIVSGTVTASSGGVINTLDGASITFPANAFVTQAGAAYNGTVYVYVKWIDPTAANLPLIMPGDLRGVDSTNGEYILKSYGMLGAELKDNSGNTLKIAAGKTAAVSFPIPSSLQATAPQTIPLWHFDETAARWKQEGTATKSGNNYVGQVNKFSFWNVDVPGNFVTLDLRLINSSNNLPLANTMVKITSLTTGMSANGFTNDSGFVSGPVPKNQDLKLEVIAGTACNSNTVVYTQNIGPYTSNTSLGNISVTLPANQVINFTGNVVNCSNQPVTNGYVSLSLANGNSAIAYTNASGAVNFSLIHCGGTQTYTYTAVDLATGGYSTIATGTATTANVNLGTVSACGNVININGVYIAGSIDNNAVLWKDGVATTLTNFSINSSSYAYATNTLVVNNDVYVIGGQFDSTVSGNDIYTIKLWKNGIVNDILTTTNETYAYSFDMSNNDVYTLGSEFINGLMLDRVWKNATPYTLAKDTFISVEGYEIKVINNDVYVCGSGFTSSGARQAVYWKNNILTVLPSYIYGFGPDASATSIDYYNGDLYIAGAEGGILSGNNPERAVYWKNGVRNVLPLHPSYSHTYGRCIAIDNGNIIVAGDLVQQVPGVSYVRDLAWWNNGTISIAATNPINSTANYDYVNDMFAKNNIVYMIGAKGSQIPLYLQNNVPMPLSGINNAQNVELSGIFVK